MSTSSSSPSRFKQPQHGVRSSTNLRAEHLRKEDFIYPVAFAVEHRIKFAASAALQTLFRCLLEGPILRPGLPRTAGASQSHSVTEIISDPPKLSEMGDVDAKTHICGH